MLKSLSHSMEKELISPDGGPIYFESDFTKLFPEPWNAVSALIFCFIVVYWFWKLYPVRERHSFLFYSLPILLVGGVGGTLYHAFRVSRVFLVMDWLPILLLCLAASFYFLYQLRYKWWEMALAFVLFMLVEVLNYIFIPKRVSINISYVMMGLFVLTPVVLFLKKTHWKNARFIVLALVSFLLAISFRSLDGFALLPMGIHFLWHTFGAVACHYMYVYIYKVRESVIAIKS